MASFPIQGGCDCGNIRYSMETSPIFVNACQPSCNFPQFSKRQADTDESCTWCQRESGSAFGLHASIEKDRIKLLNDCKPEWIQIPSASGKGQHQAYCPSCKISILSISGEDINKPTWLIYVGTLDKPDVLSPYLTAHIFTSTKQSWLKLGDDVPVFEEDYDRAKVWNKEQLDRYRKVFGEDP